MIFSAFMMGMWFTAMFMGSFYSRFYCSNAMNFLQLHMLPYQPLIRKLPDPLFSQTWSSDPHFTPGLPNSIIAAESLALTLFILMTLLLTWSHKLISSNLFLHPPLHVTISSRSHLMSTSHIQVLILFHTLAKSNHMKRILDHSSVLIKKPSLLFGILVQLAQ
jgi:hypothetical protein